MNTTYVTTKGIISGMNLTRLDLDIEAVLERIGEDAMREMRSFATPHNYQGTLEKSITWRTQATFHKIENTAHLIDKPDNKYAVDVGSKAPHAWFRENGTGPHVHPEGSAEFLAAMKEWAASKGINWDGPPEESSRFWAIITNIRNHGTEKRPFAEPMRPRMGVIAMKHFISYINNVFTRANI